MKLEKLKMLDQINEQLIKIESDISSIKENVSELETGLNSINNEVAELKENMLKKAEKKKLEELESNVEELRGVH